MSAIGIRDQALVSIVFGSHGGGIDQALTVCESRINVNLNASRKIMGKTSVQVFCTCACLWSPSS